MFPLFHGSCDNHKVDFTHLYKLVKVTRSDDPAGELWIEKGVSTVLRVLKD
jgi:hypothetical protein